MEQMNDYMDSIEDEVASDLIDLCFPAAPLQRLTEMDKDGHGAQSDGGGAGPNVQRLHGRGRRVVLRRRRGALRPARPQRGRQDDDHQHAGDPAQADLGDWTAVYVLWRREMPRYVRAKSRIVGSLAMPGLFLGAYFFEKSEAV